MTEFQLVGIAALAEAARYRLDFADRAGLVVGYDFELIPMNEFITEIRHCARFARECAPVDYENSWVTRVVADFAALRDHGASPLRLNAQREREYRLVLAGNSGVRATFDITVPHRNATVDQIALSAAADAALENVAPKDRGATDLAAAVKQAVASFDWQHSEPLTLTPEPDS